MLRFLCLVKINRVGVVSFLKFRLGLIITHTDEIRRLKMDTDKWKSIAVPIETWKKLNEVS